MDTFPERFGMTDIGAASEAGMVVGFNEKTIHTWRNDFYASLVSPTRANIFVRMCLMTPQKNINPALDSVSVLFF